MKGIYQHCGQQHLQRYLAEFDFRYTFRAANGFTDAERTAEAIRGARGNASPTGNLVNSLPKPPRRLIGERRKRYGH